MATVKKEKEEARLPRPRKPASKCTVLNAICSFRLPGGYCRLNKFQRRLIMLDC